MLVTINNKSMKQLGRIIRVTTVVALSIVAVCSVTGLIVAIATTLAPLLIILIIIGLGILAIKS